MTADDATIGYRIGRAEQDIERLWDRKADATVVAELKKDVEAKADREAHVELRDEVRSLRRALYAFALGTVGSAIVFAFSVFELLGKT